MRDLFVENSSKKDGLEDKKYLTNFVSHVSLRL